MNSNTLNIFVAKQLRDDADTSAIEALRPLEEVKEIKEVDHLVISLHTFFSNPQISFFCISEQDKILDVELLKNGTIKILKDTLKKPEVIKAVKDFFKK